VSSGDDGGQPLWTLDHFISMVLKPKDQDKKVCATSVKILTRQSTWNYITEMHSSIWPGYQIPEIDYAERRACGRHDKVGHARFQTSTFGAILAWSIHTNRKSLDEKYHAAIFLKDLIEKVKPTNFSLFRVQGFMEYTSKVHVHVDTSGYVDATKMFDLQHPELIEFRKAWDALHAKSKSMPSHLITLPFGPGLKISEVLPVLLCDTSRTRERHLKELEKVAFALVGQFIADLTAKLPSLLAESHPFKHDEKTRRVKAFYSDPLNIFKVINKVVKGEDMLHHMSTVQQANGPESFKPMLV